MDSARLQSNTNLHRTPRSPKRVRMEAWRQRQINLKGDGMTTTTEIRKRWAARGGEKGKAKNQPAAARNLMPPFPGRGLYGTDPRRQGYVAGEILRKRENFTSHRDAPLTAPVPFPKAGWISEKGGDSKGIRKPAGAGPDVWPNNGQQGTGAPPLRPRTEKIQKISLDTRGPSHGSRDREGAVSDTHKKRLLRTSPMR